MKGSQKSVVLSVSLILSQIIAEGVTASELSYSGTTQISTVDYALDINTFSTQLEVEEVYVSAGDVVSEGDAVLKFTEESYQNAVSYYEAALLKANNALTDTQREYDNGVLEAQSTYDIAQADADNAEFIRDYQTGEVASALEEHEEILEKIDERIEELQSGIDDGSYETSTSTAGGFGSTGAGSAGGNSGSDSAGSGMPGAMSGQSETESGQKKNAEKETETESTPSGEGEINKDNLIEAEKETEASGEEKAEQTTTPYIDMQSFPETEAGQDDAGTEDAETERQTTPVKDDTQERETEQEIDESDPQALLEKIAEIEAALEEKQLTLEASLEEALNTVISEQCDMSEDYSTYAQQLTNMIRQLQTNIGYGNTVKNKAQASSAQSEAISSVIEGDEAVLASLEEIQGKIESYGYLINTVMAIFPTDSLTQKAVLSSDTLNSINEYMNQVVELAALYQKLLPLYDEKIRTLEEQLREANAGQSSENSETKGTEQILLPETENAVESESETAAEENATVAGTDVNKETEQEPGKESGKDASQAGFPSSGDKAGSGMPGSFPTTTDTTDASNSQSAVTGDVSGAASPAAGTSMPSGFSGGSLPSGSANFSGSVSASAAAGGDAGAFSSAAAPGAGNGMENQIAAMDGSDISLLGNTYDLTSTENLLEREPADSDAAEDLITELEEAKAQVQLQYEELQRKERSYELQIQYTYDTAVLSGQLSEITYQEELKNWEQQLSNAKDTIANLEEEQRILTACEDGILKAAQSGTLAAVNYEAEDTINPMTPILSYYEMDVVSVALEVPQEEIHLLAVGDTVEVTLGGRSTYEGTVSEKAIEPDSGTARGDVEYTVMVSIDNKEGRISSGTAATVVIKDETGEENDE